MGDAEVVVSMTSHGSRVERVHHALESIARGRVRPTRMILWIDEALEGRPLPAGLRRLQRRGLEVRYHKDDIGPHMKYFPYVLSEPHHDLPLATGDDDLRYGKDWLAGLLESYRQDRRCISVYASKRITFVGNEFAPWLEFPYLDNALPDPRNAVLGWCGAIYPPPFLDALRDRGDGFRNCCPRADDIWLTFVAVTSMFPVRQVRPQPIVPGILPWEEKLALRRTNLVGGKTAGGNDEQLAQTFKGSPRKLFEPLAFQQSPR